ncbi:eIF-2-alpha kinase GCN2-like [Macrobrachium nipponense]|uniref:eIF-2-alpha kinase GCN2-like n=1 Tax=Macrobrachium nipponense TaxID=159736 RepID=UPI0030C7C20D
MEDSLLDVVEGEVEIIRSAYSEEFTDLREQDVWKVPRPPEVSLKLGPHHSQGGTLHSHVHVVLRIKTNEKYPWEAPEIILESNSGLAHKEVSELEFKLKNIAENFAQDGMVVMLELCQCTQSFLSEHARPYSDSIYDEMMAGKAARKQANEEAKQKSRRQREQQEEEQRTVNQEEVARVKEELKEAERQRRERTRMMLKDICQEKPSGAETCDSPSHRRMKNRTVSECSSDGGSGEPLGSMCLKFPIGGKQERAVTIIGCIAERQNQGCSILETFEKSTGEHGVVYHWEVKLKRIGRKGNLSRIGQETQLEDLTNKFSVLEKEMTSILKLSHANLIHYWGMKVNVRQNEGLSVSVLQEYLHGTSMSYYVQCRIPVSGNILKHITKGTLEALNYLHMNNVVHRDLRDSSIYLDNQSRLVRVADYGAERKIVEAVMEFNESLKVPASYPISPGRGGKKGDIYRLGLVILSLFLGDRVQVIVPSLPPDLNVDLKDFLQHCLEVSDQDRWTTERLLTHTFVNEFSDKTENTQKDENSREGCQDRYDSQGDDDLSSGEGGELSREMPFDLPPNLKGFSRLREEYVCLEWLGKGGFGHVYKVRNIVDEREYALKRIPLHQQKDVVRRKIIKEVKLLSSLNHENVVRYYTSWIEKFVQDENGENTEVDGISVIAKDTSPTDTENTSNSQVTPSTDKFSSDSKSDQKGYVRNIVDEREYALKRIPLHQQKDVVRRKIIKEVKLLSSLNKHENVVRYYTSIGLKKFVQAKDEDEVTILEEQPQVSQSQVVDDDNTPIIQDENGENTEVDGISVIAKDTSPTDTENTSNSQVTPSTDKFSSDSKSDQKGNNEDSDWSILFEGSTTNPNFPATVVDDDESDEDEEDWLISSLAPMMKDDESSEDVEFYDSQNPEIEVDGLDRPDGPELIALSQCQKKVQYLYIQMQLCEKHTLRQAIDNGLYLDVDRMWRLFREMVNGLDYIHAQGLIHRDLKPGNIFLDSCDHIKIGDFGLATAAIKAKKTIDKIPMADTEENKDSVLTGQVGTTFYIAPEVTEAKGKVSYTNKVDIYSLGIIFFEMVYPPLKTGMERVKVLSDLRMKEIHFPPDLKEKENFPCRQLVRLLLNHDPHSRPTTTGILKSSLLPPPTAEEQKFMETLESKLHNTRSSSYQEILTLVFKPSARPELEATFECRHPISSDYSTYWKQDYLHSLINAVFKAHGGIWIPTSFYIPKGSFYEDKDNLVCLMSRRGELISAQYELRYPFARFVARNEIKYMRRYCIDRVQRAYKVCGVHPKECYECAFDIISSKREASESAARVMLVTHDLIQQIIQERTQDIKISVGHMGLVHVILKHCGIDESLHNKLIILLKEWNGKRMTFESLGEWLRDLGVARSSAESLKGFLVLDGPVEEVIKSFKDKGLTSRHRSLIPLVKQIISEIEDITETAFTLGVKYCVQLKPMMVADVHLYCGFMCQFLMDVRKKNNIVQELLAQGGGYEQLIQKHGSIWHQLFWISLLVVYVNQSTLQYSGLSVERNKIVCFTKQISAKGNHEVYRSILNQTTEEAESFVENRGIPNWFMLMGGDKSNTRSDSKNTGVNSPEDIQLNITFITNTSKKQSKGRDPPKEEMNIIHRDVMSAVTNRWPNLGPSTTLEVWAVDLDKRALLAFGMLDTDSSSKNFKDSVKDLKLQFQDQKDYIEEISNQLHRKIFPRKKSERCLPIILYSTISSGTFKRVI